MKLLLQRVSKASVHVDGALIASIDQGLLIFIGFGEGDIESNCNFPYFIKKCSGLRLFEDEAGKMNLSIDQVEGKVLVVSQFTLYAELSKGMRPSFTGALEPTKAQALYKRFCDELEKVLGPNKVARGAFGAHMEVSLVNDGPATFCLG